MKPRTIIGLSGQAKVFCRARTAVVAHSAPSGTVSCEQRRFGTARPSRNTRSNTCRELRFMEAGEPSKFWTRIRTLVGAGAGQSAERQAPRQPATFDVRRESCSHRITSAPKTHTEVQSGSPAQSRLTVHTTVVMPLRQNKKAREPILEPSVELQPA